MKYTVLVKYWEWVGGEHWAFDPIKQINSKIVKVDDLEEINGLFKNVKDVKILNCSIELNAVGESSTAYKMEATYGKCALPYCS